MEWNEFKKLTPKEQMDKLNQAWNKEDSFVIDQLRSAIRVNNYLAIAFLGNREVIDVYNKLRKYKCQTS